MLLTDPGSQRNGGAGRLGWRRPRPSANDQTGGDEGITQLIDVQPMPSITRIEVRDDGHDVEVGREEGGRVASAGSSERVGELVRRRRDRGLVGGESDHRARVRSFACAR